MVQRDISLMAVKYSNGTCQYIPLFLLIRHRLTNPLINLHIKLEIEKCFKNYQENQCAPDSRVPAMEADCQRWDECRHWKSDDFRGYLLMFGYLYNTQLLLGSLMMRRNPILLTSSAKVFARIIGEIIDSFVEPMSYKTTVNPTFSFLYLSVVIGNMQITHILYQCKKRISRFLSSSSWG